MVAVVVGRVTCVCFALKYEESANGGALGGREQQLLTGAVTG